MAGLQTDEVTPMGFKLYEAKCVIKIYTGVRACGRADSAGLTRTAAGADPS